MSLASATAGPSRLPFLTFNRSRQLLNTGRNYATTSSSSDDSPDEPPLPFPLDVDTPPTPREEEMDKDARAAALRERQLYASSKGFEQWKRSFGSQFARHNKGERAKWLGGGVPFPANPTFRPPPPLSNDLQDALYRELTAGRKTVGALANEYSVSKARIEAVRKLKEVEAEMKRQSLPLQQAFLDGMEPLLAVHTAFDPRTKQYSERVQREAALIRESHPSSSVEREEEQRYEAGVGDSGAFGDRMMRGQTEGIERSAWEWRNEDAVLGASAAMEAAKEAGRAGSKLAAGSGEGERILVEVHAAEEAFPTPLLEVVEAAEQLRNQPTQAALPSTTVGTDAQKTTVFRFIDASSRGIFQDKHVQKAIVEREKQKAKKVRRKAARV